MKTKNKSLFKFFYIFFAFVILLTVILIQYQPAANAWTENNCYIHLQKGSGSWTDIKMSGGKIQFCLTSTTTCNWDLVAEGTWYKKASNDAAPSSDSSSSTTYYAKTSGSDFSVSLTAGVYTIEYVSRLDSNATLSYHFYKSESVHSSGTNVTLYYDNSISQWSNVYFRIGHLDYTSSYKMTAVTGTTNLYKYTLSSAWSGYVAFNFSKEQGSTGDGKSIYLKTNLTACTQFKKFDLAASTSYFFTGQDATTGTSGNPHYCACLGATGQGSDGDTTASNYTTYTKSVTVSSVDHGTVSVSYKNTSGTTQTIAEGNTANNILINTTLTITSTADSGYAAENTTVTNAANGASQSVASGGTTYVTGSGTTTVTGSFYSSFTITQNKLYYDNTASNWSNVYLYYWKHDGTKARVALAQQNSGKFWKYTSSTLTGVEGFLFKNSDDTTTFTNKTEDITSTGITDITCYTSSGSSSPYSVNTTYTVAPASVTLTKTGTTWGGSGTSSDPYLVTPGTAITVSATSTMIDSSVGKRYRFFTTASPTYDTYGSSSSYTNTNGTYTVSSNPLNGTTYYASVAVSGYYSSKYSRTIHSSVIYFKCKKSSYTVHIDADTGGTVSPSGDQTVGSSGLAVTATPSSAKYVFDTWTADSGITPPSGASGTLYAEADGDVLAKFKAAPTGLTNVKIRITGNTIKTYSGITNNGTDSTGAQLYYGQNFKVNVTGANTYQDLSVVLKDSNGNTVATKSTPNITSGTEFTLKSNLTATLAEYDPSAKFSLEVTATNAPSGVTAATATKWTMTNLTLVYSPVQQAYKKLEDFVNNHIEEDDDGIFDTYFNEGVDASTTEVSAYNSCYQTADALVTGTIPAYNAADNYTTPYNNLVTAFGTMMTNCGKETKVYVLVLVKSDYSTAANVNAHINKAVSVANIPKAYAHFYSIATARGSTGFDYATNAEAVQISSSNNYRMYSFSCYGYAAIKFYYNSGAYSSGNSLGVIVNPNSTGDRFVDFKANTKGTFSDVWSNRVTAGDYNKLGGSFTSDVVIKKSTNYTISTLINGSNMNRQVTGSLSSYATHSFAVYGPINSDQPATNRTYSGTTSNVNLPYSGHYYLRDTMKVGKKASATSQDYDTYVIQGDIYVEFEDVDVYIDMNGNAGTPSINFEGTYNSSPIIIPVEFSLMENSESVYHAHIKLKELDTTYSIRPNSNASTPYPIYSISVDDDEYLTKKDGTTHYAISAEALKRGQAWIKADATNMKEFVSISYAALTNSYSVIIPNSAGTGEEVFDASESGYTSITDASGKTAMPISSVTGTGIIADSDNGDYSNMYAAVDGTAYNFSYNVNATALTEFTTVKNGTTTKYYFDGWRVGDSATYKTENPTLNIKDAPLYSEGAKTYYAVYKKATSSSKVRLMVTYNFKDYNTDDGNYVFDENKTLKSAEYFKVIKMNQTDASASSVTEAMITQAVSVTYMPQIKSNYFNYSYASMSVNERNTSENKIRVTVTLNQTPRQYRILVDGTQKATGYYMQPVDITVSGASASTYWYTSRLVNAGGGKTDRITLGKGTTYKARFVSSYNNDSCLYLKTTTYTSDLQTTTIEKSSAILNSFSEVYVDNNVEKAKHNFYIVDYITDDPNETDANRLFLGGGVVYATYENGQYRTASARAKLTSTANIVSYIEGVLGKDSNNMIVYNNDYAPQTIDNIGFCYQSFKTGWDVFRYSDLIDAYHYTTSLVNTNNPDYGDQKLRVFSYYIYKTGTNTYNVVVSPTFAEVSRYIAS